MTGRVYAVASGKGGVGKTVTVASLGATVAAAGGSAAVVDADFAMPNLGPALGVEDAPPTVHDVLAGEAEAASAARIGPHGLSVLPGARDLDAFTRCDPDELSAVLAALAEDHDHVFVDAGAGLSTDTLAPLRAADETLLVATPAREALADAARTREAVDRVDAPVRGAVVTRADEETVEEAADRLDCAVLGAVPTDPAVETAVEAGVPLVDHAAGSPADRAYHRIADDLVDVAVPSPTAEPTSTGASAETAGAETDGGTDADEGGGLLSRLRGLV